MIHSIVGLMSSGKTLFMTYLLYKDYLRGRTIFSNYPLNFPHYLINNDYILQLAKEQPNLKNISFGLDELWINLGSRSSMSHSNILGSFFFLQSSKGDTFIYLSSQDNSQNEKRIRDNQHLITICSRRLLINGNLVKISDELRDVGEKYYDKLFISFKTYSQVMRGIQKELKLKEKGFLKAQPIFNLYDTERKVKHDKL